MTKVILDTPMHGGQLFTVQHKSKATQCNMEIAFFLPSQSKKKPCRAIIYLSGLTCTWENAVTKAGAQYFAEKNNVALIFPDTSPRGEHVPNDDQYDLGQGAGFYLNATEKPWASHFNMEDYVLYDIIELIKEQNYPIETDSFGITGHSMGGHGALSLAIKNPTLFTSVSAFAPIVNPSSVPWGQKAFTAYLGNDQQKWEQYDSCMLIEKYGLDIPILIDQGKADTFLQTQLQPEMFVQAAQNKKCHIRLRLHDNYDHSYYFVASFMEDHIAFHCQ